MTKKTRQTNAGRRYSISEWVEFAMAGMAESEDMSVDDFEFTKALEKAQATFTKEAARVVRGWAKKHPDMAAQLVASDSYESDDDIAYNTWADFEGEGVGFWEDMESDDYDNLKAAIRADKKLRTARGNLENEMREVLYAPGLSENPKASNPETSGLKKSLLR
jgi:hypothetical protein